MAPPHCGPGLPNSNTLLHPRQPARHSNGPVLWLNGDFYLKSLSGTVSNLVIYFWSIWLCSYHALMASPGPKTGCRRRRPRLRGGVGTRKLPRPFLWGWEKSGWMYWHFNCSLGNFAKTSLKIMAGSKQQSRPEKRYSLKVGDGLESLEREKD